MKKGAISYEQVIKRVRRLGAKEVGRKTGFSEGMITSWIYGVYQPSSKQVDILKKQLFGTK